MLIQENDLIAVFSQFPFDAIFKHLLKMDPNIPSKELVTVQQCMTCLLLHVSLLEKFKKNHWDLELGSHRNNPNLSLKEISENLRLV